MYEISRENKIVDSERQFDKGIFQTLVKSV